MLKFIAFLFVGLITYNTIFNQKPVLTNYGNSVATFNTKEQSVSISSSENYFIFEKK
jgi:hypothetical protein